jgi:hypothetical protein
MRLGVLPYLLGAFFLIPLGIWSGLWLTGLGGPKPGFEEPLANALFLVSIPLVLWFLVASLGSIANSMSGASEFQPPRFAPARWLVRSLPVTALVLGVAGALYLKLVEGPNPAVVLPLALALLVAFAIRRGEAQRTADARALPTAIASPYASKRGTWTRTVGAVVLGLAWLAALVTFGPILVLWTALAATPTMFVLLVVLTSSR